MNSIKNPSVSIIIVNWNGIQDTIECIESLKKNKYKNYSIIVVDNGSTNNDWEILSKRYGHEIHLIRSEENLGFAGGTNLGLNYALDLNFDYIMLLNNDTVVENDFLKGLLDNFTENNKVGIVAPVIFYYDRPNFVWSAGGYISRLRGSGFSFHENENKENIIRRKSVTFVSGCCMLIKKEVFRKIGLFDENYFLYLEDLDICKRAIDNYFEIAISYESRIYHKVNSSSKDIKDLPLYYTTRNRLYFVRKYFNIFVYAFFIYLSATISVKLLLNKNRMSKFKIYYISISDFFKKKMGRKSFNENMY